MRMTTLALTLIAGLAMPALADEPAKKPDQPATPPPATEPAKAPAEDPAKPAAADPAKPADAAKPATPAASPELPALPPPPPPAPAGIPVPNLPVVSTQTLDGGLVIEELKIGEGAEVKVGGSIVGLYHGTLKADPTKIVDSTFNRGEPVPLPLPDMIEGWQKGVPGMKVGGIRRLTIPAKLAFGERALSPEIPANSDMVFIVQVIDTLQTQDIQVGTGTEEVGRAALTVCNYSMKDKDGKEVEANKMYIWLPGEFDALAMGMQGMKVGGKRTITIPALMNVAPPDASTRTQKVPLTVEVEVVALRNLPQQRRQR